MHIRNTLILVIFILLLAIGAAIFAGVQLVLLPAIGEIESTESVNNLLRVNRAIENELENLEIVTIDWSSWDDTYDFVLDRNGDYVTNNLMDETFSNLRLDYVILYDLEGKMVFGKGYDSRNDLSRDIPEELTDNPIMHLAGVDNQKGYPPYHEEMERGMFHTSDGVLQIIIKPILHSDDSGPMAGNLLFGRYLDESQISRIGQLTSTNLSIYSAREASILELFNLKMTETGIFRPSTIVSPDGSTISAFMVHPDIFGDPGLVLKVDNPRTTYLQSQESLTFFLLMIMMIGAVSLLSVIYFLNRSFLSRLSILKEGMERVGTGRDFSFRLDQAGNDELSSLSSGVNSMLDSLEEHIKAQNVAEESARIANEKLRLLIRLTRHDIINQVMAIEGYVELLKDETSPDSRSGRYIENIRSAIYSVENQLSFTRDYEKMGLSSPEWFNIRELVEKVTTTLNMGKIRISVDTDDLEVFSDPLLEKIFYSLIENSLRHGRKVTSIRVSFHEGEAEGVLVFEDDGIGIPAEEKSIIFEMGVGTHTGLGLFLTREILALTGIAIRETGTPGEGVRFEIRIPPNRYRLGTSGDT